MRNIKFLLGALALILSVAATSIHADVIIQEDFGGTGVALNGTSAETFTANGTGIWVANANFTDSGGFVSTAGENTSAHLTLGEFINDTKGTADGLFELTSTFQRTGGAWFQGVGFSSLDSPNVNGHFLSNSSTGSVIQRSNNELDIFTLANANGAGVSVVPGVRTVTIELDLRGHDGITNFGTATYFADGVAGPIGSFSYASDTDFQSILISGPQNAAGTISSLSLTQVIAVPEPGSLALLGLGSLVMVARRRKS